MIRKLWLSISRLTNNRSDQFLFIGDRTLERALIP